MAAITLSGVEVRYGATVALRDVSLDIADGEFFAVLGPPGAGKTTLLRTIVGLETPVAGDVLIDGERVNDVWPGDRDISIVFQNLALYPDKSVYDNLNFPLKQRKVPKPEAKRRIEETAKILRITHLMDRKPGKLSGGERQRVALGRAMVRDPRAYLFDEPLSALDALLRLEMRIELKHMQRDLGRTLVYVTHDQIEAMSMPDRVAVLREGVIQQVASPEEIYNQPANRFVATVVGSPPMNFLPVTAAWNGGALELRHELTARPHRRVGPGRPPGPARRRHSGLDRRTPRGHRDRRARQQRRRRHRLRHRAPGRRDGRRPAPRRTRPQGARTSNHRRRTRPTRRHQARPQTPAPLRRRRRRTASPPAAPTPSAWKRCGPRPDPGAPGAQAPTRRYSRTAARCGATPRCVPKW